MALLEAFDKVFVIINLFLQNGYYLLITGLFILLVISFLLWGVSHAKKV